MTSLPFCLWQIGCSPPAATRWWCVRGPPESGGGVAGGLAPGACVPYGNRRRGPAFVGLIDSGSPARGRVERRRDLFPPPPAGSTAFAFRYVVQPLLIVGVRASVPTKQLFALCVVFLQRPHASTVECLPCNAQFPFRSRCFDGSRVFVRRYLGRFSPALRKTLVHLKLVSVLFI